MPKLIKDNSVLENNWSLIDKDHTGELKEEKAIVPLQYFLAQTEVLLERENIGVWLDSDEGPEELVPFLDQLNLIAINFPAFADGRGYSYARLLRDRYGYTGELRAVGDVLHDQLFYLGRCGFDSFAVREDKDAEVALSGLNDFSVSYQAACDKSAPLFRRR